MNLTALVNWLKDAFDWLQNGMIDDMYDLGREILQGIADMIGAGVQAIADLIPDVSGIVTSLPDPPLILTNFMDIARWVLPLNYWAGLLTIIGVWALAHLCLVPLLRLFQVAR